MVRVVSLSTLELIPQGLTPEIVAPVFGVWFSRVALEGPQTNSVSLPPVRSCSRLARKLFRRERAISAFDQTFTPPHKSSPRFSTQVGSVLHAIQLALQPAHGQVTQFRVYCRRHCRPIQTRFPFGSSPEGLNHAADSNSPDHYAKGTPSHIPSVARGHSAPTACRHTVSDSISLPQQGFFSPFDRSTGFTIGHQGVCSLTGWSPQIQSGFHVTRPTQVPLGR
eukprot:TRINITY_DN5289_c0_g2_i3.p1 TRINITY_DN5289_c0_g2~~TRINITY_DN5289_c0_g2_i3.p1  ORF type:complete len:223 (+),score=-60.47 TRINITY_DN5289_c0_g2_i3:40-708(+)